MISKQQYIRLSTVLTIPLLLLGGWAADKEIFFSRHHVMSCEEFDTHLTCNSIATTKNAADNDNWPEGNVLLQGARLASQFKHPVVTLGTSQITVIDGKTVTLPPAGGGLQKILELPKKFAKTPMYCHLSPIMDTDSDWGYTCIGSETEMESFRFQNEETNKKFREATKYIEEQERKNVKDSALALTMSFLAPAFLYLLLSAAIVLLKNISSYVIKGPKKNA